jgi:hypothetical protein
MTNEEIKQKLVDIWDAERARDERLHGEGFAHDLAVPRFDERIRRASAKLCISLVSQAYQEAARMACGHCLNGRQVERRGEDWHHPAHSYWPDGRCAAGSIHALNARLVQEPVSSS